MFSNGSSSSISLLTVTPSLVDGRATEGFVNDYIATARAERDGHGVGQLIHAGEHLGSGGVFEH